MYPSCRDAEKRAQAEARARAELENASRAEALAALARKRASLPPEPPAGAAGAVVVAVRFPDGGRLPPRRFASGDRVASLYAFVDVARADRALAAAADAAAAEPNLADLWGCYDLVTTMPARALTGLDQTVEEAGLSGQVLLSLQERH